jgi:chromosome condensin MukBEF complex kleisin-like MukF subunit
MAKTKTAKNNQKPRVRRGDLERDERIRLVEYCLSMGRSSRKDIQAEFRSRGIDIHERTIDTYIADVRDRLRAEDEKVRRARRVRLNEALEQREQQIVDILVENNVMPRWADVARILKLRVQIAKDGYLSLSDHEQEIVGKVTDELELMNLEEIDEKIQEMMTNGGVSSELRPPSMGKDTVH